MNKIEPNMYVRTKKGIIEKVIDKYEAPYGYKVVVNEDCRFKHYEHNYIKHILKASHNIIDLIEVGDYVNGYYVEDVKETFVNIATGSNYFQKPSIFEDDIKSIVTKEQFEAMTYKVGGNNE